MKPKLLSSFLSAVGLAMALSSASAQPRPAPMPPGDQRLKMGADAQWRPNFPREKEVVTFLGVETAPVSETLGSQLSLQKNSGLVVIHLLPDGPAAAALKQHDVLVKLDDQLLVEPRQFSVLIRNHNEGDEVTFTYIRAGKSATAKIKLGKHEVPKGNVMMPGEGGPRQGMFDGVSNPPGSREETDRVLGLIQRGTADREFRGTVRVPAPQGWTQELRRDVQGFRATNVNPGNSSMLFTDEQGSLDLTIKDGKRTLVAKNPKGEQIFSGPVNTPEERSAMPSELRQRLDKLEGMQDFTFKTEEGFVPSTRSMRSSPQGIAFPLPADRVRPVPMPRQIF
ncbi:MAG: PDZ domain-containing protein [Opitutaceae bacterium]